MGHIIRNLVSFKAGWLACVVFAAAGNTTLALASALVVAALHLLWVPVQRKEALLLLAAIGIGFAWESLLVATGVVSYPGHEGSWFAPLWIVSMWALFATTLNHGMRWIKRSFPVASLAGLVGGPMAFFGGMKMGAVTFADPILSLAAIGAGWAVLLPVLVIVADSIIDMTWLEPGSEEAARNRKPQSLAVGFE